MLPREHRMIERSQFRCVQSRGNKFVGSHFILRALPDFCETSKIGFTVSEKVGKAVVRNRIKRRLREAVRANTEILGSTWGMVFIARPGCQEASLETIKQELNRALKHLGRNRSEI